MVTINAHIAKEKYQTTIKSATNLIVADEPEENGGNDFGFSPSELLAASLGACTSITLRMYADRKGWDLEDLNVEVSFTRDPEKNMSTFTRKIKFTGSLTGEQKERLMKIADSCPTHKALTNPITVNTEQVA
ncbi:MAG: redox protein regulator of disulfide bond formation [Bacteroidetes bacterium]|nr:redox protein regulator of disulfide bond formation [Bacteroidota bacterium]